MPLMSGDRRFARGSIRSTVYRSTKTGFCKTIPSPLLKTNQDRIVSAESLTSFYPPHAPRSTRHRQSTAAEKQRSRVPPNWSCADYFAMPQRTSITPAVIECSQQLGSVQECRLIWSVAASPAKFRYASRCTSRRCIPKHACERSMSTQRNAVHLHAEASQIRRPRGTGAMGQFGTGGVV
jgi:hypothetical protein